MRETAEARTEVTATGERDRSRLERIVLDWQAPIYNLALKMLGNDADAADATQEVFLRIFAKLHAYDPTRPFKPWIYRVAVHRISNYARSRRLRRWKEALTMRREEGSLEEDPLEREETERLLAAGLARLELGERTLLALHYQNGLTQAEVAETLGLPRTTVETRLARAIASLKRVLARSGALAMLPLVETNLRALPPAPVPPGLTSSLLTLAAETSGTALAAGTMTLGGMLVTKKAALITVALGFLCLGSGYWAGRGALTGRAVFSEKDLERQFVRKDQHERLQGSFEKASRELERLKALLGRREKGAPQAEGTPGDALNVLKGEQPAGGEDAAAADTQGAAPEETVVIDWSRTADLAAQNLDLLIRDVLGETLTSDEQERIMALKMELAKVIQEARKLSDYPFFDERVLPGFFESMSRSLDLSPEQIEGLRSIFPPLFEEKIAGFDRENALPVETYRLRQQVVDEIRGSMDGLLDETQKDSWDKIKIATSKFLEGDRSLVTLPWRRDGDQEPFRENIVRQWKDAYALDEGQEARLRPISEDYLRGAQEILERYGQSGDERRQIGPEERRRMMDDFLDLQILKEKELRHLLTPEQKRMLGHVYPTVIRFEEGDSPRWDRRNEWPM